MNTRNMIFAAGLAAMSSSSFAQQYDLSWFSIDSGGMVAGAAGQYTLGGTIGQPDAGFLDGGVYTCLGGFWGGGVDTAAVCYANCDGSTADPILNANDFQCFLNAYAAGQAYANCDGSTADPILNANDFQCFLNKYAAGCT